ncbi:hypothetical protein DSO57_1028242 [Entomophthora muscae]|uniref:Uncharacterized protein n=1 Tax=Entomophthora muscae TaxID=34485 RepID=A0ACC2UAI5_9FUNG|nr:hypothetical protein DSO57_1028242 [Entomophthora muscae]
MIEKWDKELAEAQDILAVLPSFGCTTTCVEISIQKVKIKAVLDTGSPVNVVSSKLVKKLKLTPNLNYHQLYGTTGLSMTCTIGAYSALPMWFGKLLLAAPAVILENESYNLLVGTQFLRKYNGIINLKDDYLSFLGYKVPLIFEEPVKVPRKRLKTCALEYPTGVFTLKYCTHSSNMKCLHMACPASEGIPLLATFAITIPPGSQAILDSQILYELPECTFLELYSPPLLSHSEPVKIDNSSPLETQAWERDSNPGPGSLQAARPMDCWAARPCFLGIKPLQAEAPVNSQSQNTNISPTIVAPKEEPFELPNEGSDGAYVSFMSLKSSQATNQEPTQERGTVLQPSPMTTTLKQDNQVAKLRILTNERTPGPSAILLLSDSSTQFPQPSFPQCPENPWKMLSLEVGCYIDQRTLHSKLIAIFE